ncbi:hypothetical protein QYF36_025288 [Acer negundo]|nr:hypothetical protein QYF36_025288 [Acer negundo]
MGLDRVKAQYTLNQSSQDRIVVKELREAEKETKSCCGSPMSYKSSSCVSTTPPKKETTTCIYVSTSCASTPKTEQPMKTEVSKIETSNVGVIQTPIKTEEKQSVTVKQEEPVKINVGK